MKSICDKHNEILNIVKNLKKDIRYAINYRDDSVDDLIEALQDIDCELDDIQYTTEDAKEYGQSMEDRLSRYRQSIEELGYIREYK